MPALGVVEDRVGGAVAGPEVHLERAVAQLDHVAVVQHARHVGRARPRRGTRARPTAARCTTSSGIPWRSISRVANVVVGLGLLASSSRRTARAASIAATSAPECARHESDQPEVVDVLVGEDHQLDVLERVAERREAARAARRATCPSWARRPPASAARPRSGSTLTRPTANGVGIASRWMPGRGRRRRRGRSLTRGSARAPRRASPPCARARRSDSRLRRSSGSVFEGRTLKCQSS